MKRILGLIVALGSVGCGAQTPQETVKHILGGNVYIGSNSGAVLPISTSSSAVNSVAGTSGQILVNGATSPAVGAVVVSLPPTITQAETFSANTVFGGIPFASLSDGQGVLGGTSAAGAVIEGQGSSDDVSIWNSAGQPAIQVIHGTQNVSFPANVSIVGNASGTIPADVAGVVRSTGSSRGGSATDSKGIELAFNPTSGTGSNGIGFLTSIDRAAGNVFRDMSIRASLLNLAPDSGSNIVIGNATGGVKMAKLTSNGYVVTTGSDGTLSVNTTPTFTVAGSNTQVQYNNSGLAGANSSFTSDGSGNVRVATLTLSGDDLWVNSAQTVGFHLNGSSGVFWDGPSGTTMTLDNSGNLGITGNLTVQTGILKTGGIAGQTAVTAAAAGNLGEIIAATEQPDTTTSVSTGSTTNAFGVATAAITLTPGHWTVYGSIYVAATSASLTQVVAVVGQTSASVSAPTTATLALPFSTTTTTNHLKLGLPPRHIVVTVNTPLYLNGQVQFTAGTCTIGGYVWAERSDNAN